MRILYGIVGEGMGHATRSRVILEHLLANGHTVRVVVSGQAHPFLSKAFKDQPRIQFEEIYGFHLVKSGSQISLPKTVWSNLWRAPGGLWKNVHVYQKLQQEGFTPDVIFSDFESWAFFYALNHNIPLVSIDNQAVLSRCIHSHDVTHNRSASYRLAKWFTQVKMPKAYHYLGSSFFFPPVEKERTTLVPPILRPEILAAKRDIKQHVVVYHPAASEDAVLHKLRKLPYTFKVYGAAQTGRFGNVELCSFSQTQFIEDLRTARAVIAAGGFSLMCEAVHLRVPMLSIPLKDQFEQELNARYLQKLGYGMWSPDFELETLKTFLTTTKRYQRALKRYRPQNNTMLFRCIDELLHSIQLNEPAPIRLQSLSMAHFEGPKLPAKWAKALDT